MRERPPVYMPNSWRFAPRVYVASSWRNPHQPAVVNLLRANGCEVYDFRADGFSWSAIDPAWEQWTPHQYADALCSDVAERGFLRDYNALAACDVCVFVAPAGRSAAWELGYAQARRKRGVLYFPNGAQQEPDLMFMLCTIATTPAELVEAVREPLVSVPASIAAISEAHT